MKTGTCTSRIKRETDVYDVENVKAASRQTVATVLHAGKLKRKILLKKIKRLSFFFNYVN